MMEVKLRAFFSKEYVSDEDKEFFCITIKVDSTYWKVEYLLTDTELCLLTAESGEDNAERLAEFYNNLGKRISRAMNKIFSEDVVKAVMDQVRAMEYGDK